MKVINLLKYREKDNAFRVNLRIRPERPFKPLCVEFQFFDVDKTIKERKIFRERKKTDGICLFCGETDFMVLEEHHIDKEKMPDFTVTLCANCHRRLHWFTGGNNGNGRKQAEY